MARVNRPERQSHRLVALSSTVGLAGLAVTAAGYAIAPVDAFYAWLTAFAFAVSLALGALLFLMIVHAAGSRWPVAVRRLTEGVAGIFPPLALAFVVIVLGADDLYVWVDPPAHLEPHLKHLIEHKRPYLNLGFFVARGVFYFAVWMFVAFMLRRWSFGDDRRQSGPSSHLRARAFSAATLPIVALTLTFAAFDWLMSLEPAWFSTVFGIYYFAGGFVASLGLLVVVARAAQRSHALERDLTRSHFYALGRLLFAFSIFWAYIAFFQALLIRLGDKPEEVTFYLKRVDSGWSVVVVILIVGRFLVPFILLLPRAAKSNPRILSALGGLMVVLHYVDVYWLVMPVAPGHGPLPSFIDLAAVVGISGVTIAFAAWGLRGRPLLPLGDPRLDEALAYRSPL